jgi:hypothetical protein
VTRHSLQTGWTPDTPETILRNVPGVVSRQVQSLKLALKKLR